MPWHAPHAHIPKHGAACVWVKSGPRQGAETLRGLSGCSGVKRRVSQPGVMGRPRSLRPVALNPPTSPHPPRRHPPAQPRRGTREAPRRCGGGAARRLGAWRGGCAAYRREELTGEELPARLGLGEVVASCGYVPLGGAPAPHARRTRVRGRRPTARLRGPRLRQRVGERLRRAQGQLRQRLDVGVQAQARERRRAARQRVGATCRCSATAALLVPH